MKILAFDASMSACSVALLNTENIDQPISTLHQVAPMQQTKLILPFIHQLLEQNGLALNQLDAYAFGAGPGSFTGIRTVSAVAQGLGLANGIPIIAISSLAALAQAAFLEQQCTHCLVAVDARMGQIYWASYQLNKAELMEPIQKDNLCYPHEVRENDMTQKWYGLGDGWEKYKNEMVKGLNFLPEMIDANQIPSAEAIVMLAQAKLRNREIVSPAQALPVYLR